MKANAIATALLLVLATVLPIASAHPLTFDDVAARLGETPEVKLAQVAVDAAARQLALLSHPGDPSLSLEPAVKALTPVDEEDGDFAEQVDITASVSLKLPLGLSDAERERRAEAAEELRLAESALARARESAWVRLLGLYQTAWLAQEEQEVLAAELAAAKAYDDAQRQRFARGEVALVELNRDEEDLREAEEAALRGALERRLAWLEVAFGVGLPIEADNPVLAKPTLPQPRSELPKPPDLVKWASENGQELLEQRAAIAQARASADRLAKTDLTLSARAYVASSDHSASLSYAFTKPEIAAGYTFPLSTIGEIADKSGSIETWSIGLGVSLGWQSGRADRLSADVAAAGRAQSEARLAAALASLELAVRSRYLQWLKAGDSLAQARRSLERALASQAIVDTRLRLGQASEFERLQAEAEVARARWALLRAEVEQQAAMTNTAEAASFVGQMFEIK